ncbi:hypothetical protein G647_02375 [Cladophialophora carrionii CBS 160.54]|uniref:FAD dependent oxidoreductase domain-containing protein n=1 Tax=Cladophialophora carrionii CBS 160.54 TaxID=1279043 RepID=V9DG03_9EURO|nr:uncharacterized protein G647_02375 [Cladophialophora carrionii CBS 160.54]ETI25601.1 hypothetical protein G647_02375 [Cladophialophora carrionii CBS 160.54]
MSNDPAPRHILIVGAGVFGLSTALSLIHNPTYDGARITIIDSSPTLPNPSGSSVDANRIVRADYANKQYAQLALQAQELWRDGRMESWGGEGRYHEPGFVLTAVADQDAYLAGALSNVRSLAQEDKRGRIDLGKIQELHGRDEIRKATGYEGVSGDHGYANFNSGWANAEACVAYALRRIRAEGGDRVDIRPNTRVQSLLVSAMECKGVTLLGGEQIQADLTVLAAGAWTPTLIDLQGRCLATGQTMAFLDITQEEQAAMGSRPTIINQSSGMFIIPPRDKLLKVARHGYGYRNPVNIPKQTLRPGVVDGAATSGDVEVSVPDVGVPIPLEAEEALRGALRELVPHMADRPFVRTRICWYCDTPTGDFLITYHPAYKRLFLATGGSGHGFKFFPVIGDKIVAAMEGKVEPELAEIWRWRSEEELKEVIRRQGEGEEFIACADGSRGGPKGMLLAEEMKRKRGLAEHKSGLAKL